MTSKVCNLCKAATTYTDKRGQERWYKKDTDFICHKCYMRTKQNPRWHKIHNVRWNPKRLTFKDGRVCLSSNLRIGVCNLCRAIAGIDCQRTAMHHDEYDPDNPGAHTLELCNRCHGIITRRAAMLNQHCVQE